MTVKKTIILCFLLLFCGFMFLPVFYYWGYQNGHTNALKEELPSQLILQLCLYDMRYQIEKLELDSLVQPRISVGGTKGLVYGSYQYYQRYKDEYDQGLWSQSPLFFDDIQKAKVISEEFEDEMNHGNNFE